VVLVLTEVVVAVRVLHLLRHLVAQEILQQHLHHKVTTVAVQADL
jgi:hypothetical protein